MSILSKKLFNDDKVKDSPHLWTVNKEYKFSDGSFGIRYTGTFTVKTGIQARINYNIDASVTNIVSCGGWIDMYFQNTVLYRFNIPVHTNYYNTYNQAYATIINAYPCNPGYNFIFISMDLKDRTNAPYDIWIIYLKK
jgi:hypothetical protein